MNESKNTNYLMLAGVLFSIAIISYAWINPVQKPVTGNLESNIEKQFIAQIIELPIVWGNLGGQMVSAGVIDSEKFESIYAIRNDLKNETKDLLYKSDNGNLKISEKNSGLILNLLWAFGLGNKNKILEEGPIIDSRFGGADKFASTGGWSLAKGNVMEHYSKHNFIILTEKQQTLVEEVSKNIYRPCCDNATYFPDCNHGMAMLGLLELLASQGVNEDQMYKVALQVNFLWFPDTYLTIAKYLKEKKNINWADADPKEVLGYNYSSASGYQNILSQVTPLETQSGGSCG